MPQTGSRNSLRAYLAAGLLVLVGLGVVYLMGPYDNDSALLDYKVVEAQEDPPREFNYILALKPPSGKLPSQEQLLAVVRREADQSLMRIRSVAKWSIGLSLQGPAPEKPFVVYSWPDQVDSLKVKWLPQNLPPALRDQVPASKSTQ